MVGSLVLVVLAIIVYFDFTQPIYQESQDIRAKMHSRQVFVDSQTSAINQVQTLIKSYQGQGQLQQLVSLALPIDPSPEAALLQLDAIAQLNRLGTDAYTVVTSGAQRSSVKTTASSTAQVGPLGTLRLQTKLTGTYSDLKNFLHNIETNIRIFDVQSISITPASKTAQDIFSFDVAIVAYYQILPQAASK